MLVQCGAVHQRLCHIEAVLCHIEAACSTEGSLQAHCSEHACRSAVALLLLLCQQGCSRSGPLECFIRTVTGASSG